MDQEQAHELLIRIDEKMGMILKKLDAGEVRFSKIETIQQERPCKVNSNRIEKLEKATYGSIFGSVLLFLIFILQWAWKAALGGKP